MPNSRAIGPVTKLLVAVTIAPQVHAVLVDQRPCPGADHGKDAGLHEALMPCVELCTRILRQRLQLEIEKLADVPSTPALYCS